jgi:hypothetical protein
MCREYFLVGVILSYVELKKRERDAFFGGNRSHDEKKRQPCFVGCRLVRCGVSVCFCCRCLVAAATVGGRCHRYCVDRSVLKAAGGGGMSESGDLGGFDALGKWRGLSFGGGGWAEGVGGDVGVGGAEGGVGGVVAAGEQTGEEASKAQGGDFEEIAFGA